MSTVGVCPNAAASRCDPTQTSPPQLCSGPPPQPGQPPLLYYCPGQRPAVLPDTGGPSSDWRLCPGQRQGTQCPGLADLTTTWGVLPPPGQPATYLCPGVNVPVQANMFKCGPQGTCVPASDGCITQAECDSGVCGAKPPPPTDSTFGCDAATGLCQRGAGGQTQQACEATCKPASTYGCDTSVTPNVCRAGLGKQTAQDCSKTCGQTPPPVPVPSDGWACQETGGCKRVRGGAWPTEALCAANCRCSCSGSTWEYAGFGPTIPPALRGRAWPAGSDRGQQQAGAAWPNQPGLRLAVDAVVQEVVFTEDRDSRMLVFANEMAQTIWVGIIGDPTVFSNGPEGWGGFELRPLEARVVPVSRRFQGKAWGRTDCVLDQQGKLTCQTGNCGIANGMPGTVDCSTKGNEPPTTLAEFNFDTPNGNDYVDVSVVDGMNLTMLVQPYATADGTPRFRPGAACGVADSPQTCSAAMVAYRPSIKDPSKGDWCPEELRYVTPGNKVYCTSPCKAVTAAVTQGDQYLPRLDSGDPVAARRALTELQTLGTAQDPVHPTGSGDRTLFNLVCSQCSTKPCQKGQPCGCGVQPDCAFGCSPYSTDSVRSPPSQRAPARPEGVPVGGCATINGAQVCDPWKDGLAKAGPWQNVPAGQPLSEMPDWPIPPSKPGVTYGSAIAAALLDGVYTWQFRDNTSTYQCCWGDYLVLFTDEPTKARNWPALLPQSSGVRGRPGKRPQPGSDAPSTSATVYAGSVPQSKRGRTSGGKKGNCCVM